MILMSTNDPEPDGSRDQAIQDHLHGLPEGHYCRLLISCETAQDLSILNYFNTNQQQPEEFHQTLSNRQIATAGMKLGSRQTDADGWSKGSGCSECCNQNGLIVVPGMANPNANQNGNGNVVATWAEGNGNGNNENQIRCYNCRGLGNLAWNCTVRPRRRDAAYLQTQLRIAQKE
ncbi:hypothetical protein Tco_0330781 [Tanacetum coccineum]